LIREYTAKGWWGTATLQDLLEKAVSRTPDAVALADPPNRAQITAGEAERLSYAELKQLSDRLAGGLVEIGLKKDDILMVQLPNVVELVVVYLAAARIGAIVSPLPVQYRKHELRQVMGLTEPRAFVTTSNLGGFDFVQMVEEIRAECPSLERVIGIGEAVPEGVLGLADLMSAQRNEEVLREYLESKDHQVSANDIVTVCWTSGTEGDPKGVPRSHNHWIWIAYATVDGCELRPGCHLLNPFPLVNMAAIGGMMVPWLLTGGRLVLHHPLDPGVLLAQIQKEKINYTVAPPALLSVLLMKPEILASTDLSSIENIGSGSAPLSPWMISQWQQKYGIHVINMFGSNEGAALTSGPKEFQDPADRAQYFPRFGVPGYEWCSRIAGQTCSKLVDPSTRAVITESGVAGEMAIKSPGIFPGYYKRPDLTEKVFDDDGYFYTGDLFEIAGDGEKLNRYRFVSRLKNIIVRGGFKISPEEIEGLVTGHPGVAEAAVVGYPDRRLGERVCLVIAPRKGQAVTLEKIVDYLKRQEVAVYKLPEKLLIVAQLPRNPIGKVLTKTLKERVAREEM
jgi:acyl-CoA synthetase (AMP-forming)/AMP-acid ligase II